MATLYFVNISRGTGIYSLKVEKLKLTNDRHTPDILKKIGMSMASANELATIKAQNALLKQKMAENERMKAELARLRSKNAQLRRPPPPPGPRPPYAIPTNIMPPPEQNMQRTIIKQKEVAGLDMQRDTIDSDDVAGFYLSICGPFPGCSIFMNRLNSEKDVLDGCFCCCFVLPFRHRFQRAPVENGSPNWYKGFHSEYELNRYTGNQSNRDYRRLHIDNKCCNHEVGFCLNCPCMCSVKIIPCPK